MSLILSINILRNRDVLSVFGGLVYSVSYKTIEYIHCGTDEQLQIQK